MMLFLVDTSPSKARAMPTSELGRSGPIPRKFDAGVGESSTTCAALCPVRGDLPRDLLPVEIGWASHQRNSVEACRILVAPIVVCTEHRDNPGKPAFQP
jgi:hypothetical protein